MNTVVLIVSRTTPPRATERTNPLTIAFLLVVQVGGHQMLAIQFDGLFLGTLRMPFLPMPPYNRDATPKPHGAHGTQHVLVEGVCHNGNAHQVACRVEHLVAAMNRTRQETPVARKTRHLLEGRPAADGGRVVGKYKIKAIVTKVEGLKVALTKLHVVHAGLDRPGARSFDHGR